MSKETVNVYRIKCIPTGRCYIGRTQDPERRLKQHFYDLNKGMKAERYPEWQADYDRYGRQAFETDVLLKDIPKECGYVAELVYITRSNSYNISQNLKKSNRTSPLRNNYFEAAYRMLKEQHKCCFCGSENIYDDTVRFWYDSALRTVCPPVLLYTHEISGGYEVYHCTNCHNYVEFCSRYWQRRKTERR